jgi:hypothetical protein
MQALTSFTPARYQGETATRHHPGDDRKAYGENSDERRAD